MENKRVNGPILCDITIKKARKTAYGNYMISPGYFFDSC